MNWISSSVGPAVEQLAGVIRLDLSNALGGLQQQSRATRIAVFVLLFGLTAWLDLVVDHNLSLFPVYLIPTLYSAWYLGSDFRLVLCGMTGYITGYRGVQDE